MKTRAPQPPARLSKDGTLRKDDVRKGDQGDGNLPPGVKGRRERRTAEDERLAGLPEDRLLELEQAVTRELVDAREYIDNEIGEERAKATQYYKGEPFGNEEEGRSQFVSRDVHDVVQSILPSLMRIFAGGDYPVEFLPEGPEDEGAARQATEYISKVVFAQDNDGFRQMHSAFKDALIRKVGVWKWWWDDSEVVLVSDHEGLGDEDLQAFAEDEEVEKVEAVLTSDEGIEPKVWSARVTRRRTRGRARFKALPGEEFLIDRRATCFEDATLVAHRAPLRVKDVVAMGYDREEILDYAGQGFEMDTNVEYSLRRPFAAEWGTHGSTPDLQPILYTEAYTYFALGGEEDAPVQLVRVCGVGLEPFKVLSVTPVDEIPFAAICPDPEPHEFFGQSSADKVDDIQLVKSFIIRSTLDSLAESITPRMEVVEDQVNLDDVLNNELGGVIRVRQPGMLREIKTSFVGAESLPMLEYFDQIREERTKQSRASQGIDADALQSTTKAAVTATMSAAQAQTELIARIFAETGVKRLFRGLLRLSVRHQDRPRMARLNNTWEEIDPRSWNAEMDVRINVALGAGTNDEKLGTLAMVKETQEGILQQLGPQNPLVSLANYRHTLAEMLKLAGWKNPDAFFLPVADAQQGAGGEQGAQANAEADAAKALADAQKLEIETKAQIEREKLALERERMLMEDRRERDKMMLDAQVKMAIAEAQHKANIDEALVTAQVEQARLQEDERIRAFEAEKAAQAAAEQERIAGETAIQQEQIAAEAAQQAPAAGGEA